MLYRVVLVAFSIFLSVLAAPIPAAQPSSGMEAIQAATEIPRSIESQLASREENDIVDAVQQVETIGSSDNNPIDARDDGFFVPDGNPAGGIDNLTNSGS